MDGMDFAERGALSACLRDIEFMREAVPVVGAYHFTNKTRGWLWRRLAWSFEKVKGAELPPAQIVFDWLKADHTSEDSYEFALLEMERIVKSASTSPRICLEEIRALVMLATARAGAQKAADAIHKGDAEGAAEAIEEAAIQLQHTTAVRTVIRPVSEEGEDRVNAYAATANGGKPRVPHVPTPFETLNEMLGGGLRSGAVGLIVAFTNVGKSALVVGFGLAALRDKDNPNNVVLHIPVEESREECLARYDASIAGIDRWLLLSGRHSAADDTNLRSSIRRANQDIYSRLYVEQIETGESVENVLSLARQVRRAHGPDAMITVFVDSPDDLAASGKAENYRIGATQVVKRLKAMTSAKDIRPCAVWETCNASVEAGKTGTIKPWHVNETINRMRAASVGIGIVESMREPSDPRFNSLDMPLVKNRQGQAKWKILHVEGHMGTSVFNEVGQAPQGSFP